MKAIYTKYISATNSRGSRIKATDGHASVMVPYNSGLGDYENYERAAHALMKKLGWSGRIIGGSFKNDYVWVFASGSSGDARRRRRRYY